MQARSLPDGAGIEVLMVAGEASGDLHGARLLGELRRLDPDLQSFGLGGDQLEAAGMEVIARSSEVSVVGITEALRVLPRARQIFHRLLAEVDRRSIKIAILIDFPDFNLRLAKALKRRGLVTVYYISPQVWAWRRRRVRVIARYVDQMLVVLPFEVDFYRQHGVPVTHVGHPLIDEIPELEHVWDRAGSERQDVYRIALLPGSRASEIESHLPILLQASRLLAQLQPVRIRLIRAPGVESRLLDPILSQSSQPIEVVSADRSQAVADCHLAICASGTATLEVGLLGTPMIVVYRVRQWTYVLGRLLVRLPFISLVNLVLNKGAVPELIQHQVSAERIARAASALLVDRDRIQAMKTDLARLRQRLGRPGASRRAAAEIFELVERIASA